MPLPNYFKILQSELKPAFRISHNLPVGLSSEGASLLDFDELIELHDNRVQPFVNNPDPDIAEGVPKGELSLLELKSLIARRMLLCCEFCENRCGVDRTSNQRGKCGVGETSYYASEFVHVGEEPEIVPSHTVFFTGCTFDCVYCQNWDIAHGLMVRSDYGNKVDDNLVKTLMKRRSMVRNLNLVGGNPDQHLHSILDLLVSLANHGYSRPIVWNSNLFMTPVALNLLTGVVDLHLADFKYGNNKCGQKYSGIRNYWDVVTRNFLHIKPVSDILIRHLVLPGHLECCTEPIARWTEENLPGSRFNLMFQYRPEYRAGEFPEINRHLTDEERSRAVEIITEYGVCTE